MRSLKYLVNEITDGHIPVGGYTIRCYFDNLLRKEITGNPVNVWNVSEEALEASGGGGVSHVNWLPTNCFHC